MDVLSVVGSNDSLVASSGRLDMFLIVKVLDVLLVFDGSVGGVVESRHYGDVSKRSECRWMDILKDR